MTAVTEKRDEPAAPKDKMSPEVRKAFEKVYKEHEETFRRLAKM